MVIMKYTYLSNVVCLARCLVSFSFFLFFVYCYIFVLIDKQLIY